MAYSDFDLLRVEQDFSLTIQEVPACLPETVYGCVTNGELWKFLTLQEAIATIGLQDYTLPPIDTVLGILVWICHID